MKFPSPTLEDRFRGCLLGQAIGDSLGAPFETMPAEAIYYGFGFSRKIVASPPVEVLEYTDDTQMMIGVAENLLEFGEIRQDELMTTFVSNFSKGRAYGQGTEELLAAAARGEDWKSLSRTMFPGGSYGNGGAMRVAPVGLCFHRDIDRVSEQAIASALPTHTHPLGVEGARLLAIAIALVVSDHNLSGFLNELLRFAETEEFRAGLTRAAELGPNGDIGSLGNSIEAHKSVPTAIACFLSCPDSYASAVARAIGLGGDVDTIAAMVGALSGARLGIAAIPNHLINLLENGPQGREYLDRLASRLHSRFGSA